MFPRLGFESSKNFAQLPEGSELDRRERYEIVRPIGTWGSETSFFDLLCGQEQVATAIWQDTYG